MDVDPTLGNQMVVTQHLENSPIQGHFPGKRLFSWGLQPQSVVWTVKGNKMCI